MRVLEVWNSHLKQRKLQWTLPNYFLIPPWEGDFCGDSLAFNQHYWGVKTPTGFGKPSRWKFAKIWQGEAWLMPVVCGSPKGSYSWWWFPHLFFLLTCNRKWAYGGFLKWWVSPTTMVFPTKKDNFWVFWGYHHLRNHPYMKEKKSPDSIFLKPNSSKFAPENGPKRTQKGNFIVFLNHPFSGANLLLVFRGCFLHLKTLHWWFGYQFPQFSPTESIGVEEQFFSPVKKRGFAKVLTDGRYLSKSSGVY